MLLRGGAAPATGHLSHPLRTYKALKTLNPQSPHCEISHQSSTSALSQMLPVITPVKALGIRSCLKLGRRARSQALQEPESACTGPSAQKPGSKEAKKGNMSISPGVGGGMGAGL